MIFVGLTAFISLMAITIHFLYKGFKKVFSISTKTKRGFFMRHATVFSVLILMLMPLAIAGVYKPIVDNMLNDQNNIKLVENALYECKPINLQNSDKYIVLRLDDVQAYGWTDISIRMMNDAMQRGGTITAGVIPKNIDTDKRIVEFFNKYECNVEIAIHGYDHGIGEFSPDFNGEFALLSEDEAKERLTLAKVELRKISKQKPVTFIPPNNQLSEGAKNAVQSEILPIISGEGDNYFDYDAATWNFVTNSFVNSDKVISDCESTFKEGKNLCVIMLHPQDFSNPDSSTDESRYNEYIKILNYFESNNIPAITFKEIASRNNVN